MDIMTILFERINPELVRMVVLESESGYEDRSVTDIVDFNDNANAATMAVWFASNTADTVVFLGRVGEDEIPLDEFETGRATTTKTKLIRMLEQI